MRSEEIIAILGPVDEAFMAEIAKTGASPAELLEAWAWVNADEALINEGRRLPSGRVAQLIELLAPDEPEE